VDAICAELERVVPALKNPALAAAGAKTYAELKRFVADRPGHDRRYAIDASKAQRELGWKPQLDLERGLAATIAWYLEHREWCSAVQQGRYGRERLGVASPAGRDVPRARSPRSSSCSRSSSATPAQAPPRGSAPGCRARCPSHTPRCSSATSRPSA
jgi:hypothetical protein